MEGFERLAVLRTALDKLGADTAEEFGNCLAGRSIPTAAKGHGEACGESAQDRRQLLVWERM